MKRKKATCTAAPVTQVELEYAVQAGLDDLYTELRAQLIDCYHEHIEKNGLMMVGPEVIGTANHERIFLQGKVPSLKAACRMANKVGHSVELKHYPCKNSGAKAYLDHAFHHGFDNVELLGLMENIHHLGIERNAVELRNVRTSLIKRFRNPRNSVRWDHLMALAALCGYQLEVRLVPQKKESAAQNAEGCLTPSKTEQTVVDARDEHQKLLDRLNYPI